MPQSKSVMRRLAIQKAQERSAAGDQHYNHAWRSLDTAETRLLSVQRSHKTRSVCREIDKKMLERRLTWAIYEISRLLDYVKDALDTQHKKEGRE